MSAKHVIFILLGIGLIVGVYYFFFSETAKKKRLVKKLKKEFPSLDVEKLNTHNFIYLQWMYNNEMNGTALPMPAGAK